MNSCKLQILFRFAEVRNHYMTVKINDSTITPTDGEVYCYEQLINLPTEINLEFNGKDSNIDTIIDEGGNIIKDKHILIQEIKLNGMPVDPLYLERRLKLEYGKQINYSNYIGFNGKMTIQFNKSDVFRQIMEWKRLGEY
jgi:hypothetical protein